MRKSPMISPRRDGRIRGTRFVFRIVVSTTASRTRETAELIRQYDRPGPRYTSYPTAVEFTDTFDEAAYRGRLEAASSRDEPLSLYVHLPFCAQRCTYCGCTMIATGAPAVAARYLDYLEKEVSLLSDHLGTRRGVVQHHWGGGTPTYLNLDQIARLYESIAGRFTIESTAEIAIEIDPRVTTREQLRLLRSLGFNRLSMGVQDFTPDVQEAIGRRQSEAATVDLYGYARQIGFDSINLDLIYGLPLQTPASFTHTLETVVTMQPDRVAVYSYAHVPWLRPHQKLINTADLPDPAVKFELIGAAVDTFAAAGYVPIGMDHFARPDDELAVAAAERRLHRNFMGYTTRPATDMLGLGVSAIGDVQGAFAQNTKKLTPYYAALDEGRFPIERGFALDADDLIRRHVITQLMCNFRIDRGELARTFGIDFHAYFAPEIDALQARGGLVDDGLAVVTPDGVEISREGRLFVRLACMLFDRYLAPHQGTRVFSRTI